MRTALCLLLLCALPAMAARRVLSTPVTMHMRHYESGNFFSTYFRLNLANLSGVAQTAKVRVRDITLEQAISVKTEADGDAQYSNWFKNTVFVTSRSREFDYRDLEKVISIPANGKAEVVFNISCVIDNAPFSRRTAPSSTCQENSAFLKGFVAPFPQTAIVGTVIASFEVITSGANADRGALLAAYSIIQNIAGEIQDLTREMNGGRPF